MFYGSCQPTNDSAVQSYLQLFFAGRISVNEQAPQKEQATQDSSEIAGSLGSIYLLNVEAKALTFFCVRRFKRPCRQRQNSSKIGHFPEVQRGIRFAAGYYETAYSPIQKNDTDCMKVFVHPPATATGFLPVDCRTGHQNQQQTLLKSTKNHHRLCLGNPSTNGHWLLDHGFLGKKIAKSSKPNNIYVKRAFICIDLQQFTVRTNS